MRQLGLDHLDLVNLRVRRARTTRSPSTSAPSPSCARPGLIRHLGVSNVGAEQLAEALAIAPVVCVQNRVRPRRAAPTDDALLDVRRARHRVRAVLRDRPRRPRRGPHGAPSTTAKRDRPGGEGARRDARRRSGSPGPCTADRTSWPSPAPAASPTSRRTSRRARSSLSDDELGPARRRRRERLSTAPTATRRPGRRPHRGRAPWPGLASRRPAAVRPPSPDPSHPPAPTRETTATAPWKRPRPSSRRPTRLRRRAACARRACAAGRAATAAACSAHAVVTRVPPQEAPRRYRPSPRRRGRPERASRALPRIGPAPNTAGRGRGRHNGAGRDDAVPRAGATDLRSPSAPARFTFAHSPPYGPPHGVATGCPRGGR